VEEFSINSATWSDVTQVKIQENSINDDRGDLLQYALTAESVFIEITNTKDQSIYGVFEKTSAAFEFGSVYSFNVSPVTTGQNPDPQDPAYSPIFTISFSFGFNPPTPSLLAVLAVGNTASGPILLEDGSSAAPSLAFISSPDTGIWKTALNSLILATEGSTRFTVSSTQIRSHQSHRFTDGTTSIPGLRFQNDLDTGIYRPDTDRLGIAAGGELIADFRPSGAYFEKNIILKSPNGSQWEVSVDNSGNLITTAVS
jgi:hypothetical protein